MTSPANSSTTTIRHSRPHDGPTFTQDGNSDPPDLLSAFLEPCRIRCEVVAPVRLPAPWGLAFPKGKAAFVYVLEGACVLELSDENDPLRLTAGDFAVLPRDEGFVLRDRPESTVHPLEHWRSLATNAANRNDHSAESESRTRVAWGLMGLDDEYSRQAFAMLPGFALLPGASLAAEAMAPLIRALLDEMSERRPGGDLLIRHLVQVLLVQILRSEPENLPSADSGLISALRVPGLGMALGAIHSRPEQDWSVRELAEIAGLSRAAFAARFVESVGKPPFEYLRDVRMHRACQLLRETEMGIKEIASRAGYATEASFSKAFTRWRDVAPGEYRRQSRASE